jgi:pimeloyl-ACP methyl ester carboxylesterase
LLGVLDAAGVSEAALVGHSMGSLIALEAASRAPERATGLVMIATAYPMKVSDALLSTASDAPMKAIDMVNVFSHSGIAAKPSYPGPGNWLRGGSRALMRRVQAGQQSVNLFHHDFSVCNEYAGGFEAAQKVRCPVNLIIGDRDQMTSPKQSREIAQALKARVHSVDAGHSLMTEAPEQVLAALRIALG